MYFLPVKLTITSEVCVINLRQFYGVICLYKKRIIKCALYISIYVYTKNELLNVLYTLALKTRKA